ncbi:MAG: class IIb bacteriocin, lactobin A/cerein 7B family [Clostridia bacterium]|nr:class IIb bacteriocin, lactobin A/cerein 7B family [Clostridia bacterium]
MNTMNVNNMKELNLNEMEQASGGILPILLGLGTLAIGGVIIAVMPDKKKK